MFCSVLNYVSLRLLGVNNEEESIEMARIWILDHGGATATPSWGKLWLSVWTLCLIPVRFQLTSALAYVIQVGYRYLEHTSGPETTHYPQSYGCYHTFFRCIQVAPFPFLMIFLCVCIYIC